MSNSTRMRSFSGDVFQSIEAVGHIQWVEAFVERSGKGLREKRMMCCVLLRRSLRDIALSWFEEFAQEIRRDWLQLREAFLGQFAIPGKDIDEDTDELLYRIQTFHQEDRSTRQYIDEAERIGYSFEGYILQTLLARIFVRGIYDLSERQRILQILPSDRPYTLKEAISAAKEVITALDIVKRLRTRQQELHWQQKRYRYLQEQEFIGQQQPQPPIHILQREPPLEKKADMDFSRQTPERLVSERQDQNEISKLSFSTPTKQTTSDTPADKTNTAADPLAESNPTVAVTNVIAKPSTTWIIQEKEDDTEGLKRNRRKADDPMLKITACDHSEPGEDKGGKTVIENQNQELDWGKESQEKEVTVNRLINMYKEEPPDLMQQIYMLIANQQGRRIHFKELVALSKQRLHSTWRTLYTWREIFKDWLWVSAW